MPLPGFEALLREVDRVRPGVPVAAAGAADPTVLRALAEARDRGWVEPVAVGPPDAIRRVADEACVGLDGFRLVPAEGDEAASAAVAEVRAGRAAMLMKGQIATPALMRAVLDASSGLRTGRTVCQVVLMEVVPHARTFLLADTGISIAPKLSARIEILRAAVDVARSLGCDQPRVAMMAASESATAAMPETVEAAELQSRAAAGDFPECHVQGPLSFDLAYAADAGDRKRIGGPVVGAADAMVFPNLLAANLTVKAIMYTADCRFGGVLRGTTHPVVFMSRADSVETRVRSIAMAIRLLPGAG